MFFDTTRSWSPRIFAAGLRCIDVLFTIAASFAVAAAFARSFPVGQNLYPAFGLSALLTCEALWLAGGSTCQDLGALNGREAHIAGSVLAGSVIVAGCFMLQPPPYSLGVSIGLAWGLTTVAMLFAARFLSSQLLQIARRSGRLVNKVAVLGDGPPAQALVSRLLKEDAALVRLVGCYRMESESREKPGAFGRNGGPAVRGDLSTLLLDCRLGGIDSIVLTGLPADADARCRVEAALTSFAVDLYMTPHDADLAGGDAKPAIIGHQSLIVLAERPLKDWRGVTKNLFDRLGALALLVGVAPMLLVVSILIRLDSPGGILFRQMRVGYNNRTFHILKFRTMHAHAADRLATVQTSRNDPRVTRLGRVLRQLSIDELPQLLNVLRGDMSLVGPRPHAPGTSVAGRRVDQLVDGYARRHLVKPGITGLAQARGFRGGMTTREQVSDRVRCDLEYIRRQSLWFDLKILIVTVLREFRSNAAC